MRKSKTGIKVGTHAEVADVYDVSPETVSKWCKRGMPGRHGAYKLREISHWLRERNLGNVHEKRMEASDPLLVADVDSPGLERYRLAKAAITELELERLKGTLIPLEKVRESLGRWASLIRRMGEMLGRRFGQEAAQAMNETLAECRRMMPTDSNDDDNPGPADTTDD